MKNGTEIPGEVPDISVIVPCFNADRYLDVCLSSICAQTGPSLQILLIDDGSTDATSAILDQYAMIDSRVQVIHTENHGVSVARNLGLSMAKGRYISFVDADDALEEHAMSILFHEAEKSGADIVSAGHTLFDMKLQKLIHVEERGISEDTAEVMRRIIRMHRVYNNLWNKLYRASLFKDDLRLDESVHIGEDALLNLQLYFRAKKVVHISAYTYVYRIHGQSAMSRIEDYCGAHLPMLLAMNRILVSLGVKGYYFRDYLESAVWIFEKETGIRVAMKRFHADIRPLVMDGVQEKDVPREDIWLFRIVQKGLFPAWYMLCRIRNKLLRQKGDRF